MTSDVKKLRRSGDNAMFLGVCAGLGEYLRVDATLIRLVTLLLCLATGVLPLVVLYLIAGFVMPEAADGEGQLSASEASDELSATPAAEDAGLDTAGEAEGPSATD